MEFYTFAVEMNSVSGFLIWLRRIFHCRGFGIQSPNDYWFVRYVINEHWRYYAYDLFDEYGDDWLTKKTGRLCFRIANWLQPTNVVAYKYKSYIKEGCRMCNVVDDVESAEMVVIPCTKDSESIYDSFASRCDENSLMLVDGIYRRRDFWQRIVSDEHSTITFDLYYCGIVFFDKKRYKQNYKINF